MNINRIFFTNEKLRNIGAISGIGLFGGNQIKKYTNGDFNKISTIYPDQSKIDINNNIFNNDKFNIDPKYIFAAGLSGILGSIGILKLIQMRKKTN